MVFVTMVVREKRQSNYNGYNRKHVNSSCCRYYYLCRCPRSLSTATATAMTTVATLPQMQQWITWPLYELISLIVCCVLCVNTQHVNVRFLYFFFVSIFVLFFFQSIFYHVWMWMYSIRSNICMSELYNYFSVFEFYRLFGAKRKKN